MEIDIELIRKNYSNFDDSEIVRIAKTEAAGIKPEVIPILIDEINKRGLDSNLIKGIEAQTIELSDDDLNELKMKNEGLACPKCGRKETPLVGTIIRKVRSYVFLHLMKNDL